VYTRRVHNGDPPDGFAAVLARFGDPDAIRAARADRDPDDPFDGLGELLDEIDRAR
jgi:hypothetical protein